MFLMGSGIFWEPLEATTGLLRASGHTCELLGASGSIRGALGIHEPRWRSGLLWEILGASGSNWRVLGTSGDAWALQGAYGSLRL